MERELKFRAWDKSNKKWIEVWKLSFAIDGSLQAVFTIEGEMYGMHQADVMQFTGLKDCKGVEIYEGDVCGYEDDPGIFEVAFIDGAWRKKYPKWREGDAYFPLTLWDVENLNVVVLGDVHQNPELLNGQG